MCKFGNIIRLSLSFEPQHTERAVSYITSSFPAATLVNSFKGRHICVGEREEAQTDERENRAVGGRAHGVTSETQPVKGTVQ